MAKRVLIGIAVVIGLVLLLLVGLIGFLTITEYKPEPIEDASLSFVDEDSEAVEVDEEFLANILMYVDIDKLRMDFFKNPELIERFMKFWKQYKIGGWNATMCNRMSLSGLYVDAEIIANFIQYFESVLLLFQYWFLN